MSAALVVLSCRHIKKAESEEYGAGSNVQVKIILLAVAYFQVASLLQGTPFFLDPPPRHPKWWLRSGLRMAICHFTKLVSIIVHLW